MKNLRSEVSEAHPVTDTAQIENICPSSRGSKSPNELYMFVLFEIICAFDQFINLCHVSGHTDHEIESESTHAARRQSETSEVDYGS